METKRIVVSQISSHKKEPEFVSERGIQNKNLFIVFVDHAKLVKECLDKNNAQSYRKDESLDILEFIVYI